MNREELLKSGATIISLIESGISYGQLLEAGFSRKELILDGPKVRAARRPQPEERSIKGNRKIRITNLILQQIKEIENYREFNYKKEYLAKQYRELLEDNPNRARDARVVRWYVRKWRKL